MTVELDPAFAPLLAPFDRDVIDTCPETIIGIWADLRIAYLNAGWSAFGLANNGGAALRAYGLGASLAGAIHGEVARFFVSLFTQAALGSEPIDLDYACPSPDVERTFRLRAYPLNGRGALIVHALRDSRPHAGTDAPADGYRNALGVVVQCAGCRRVRRPDDDRRWDWVAALIARPPPEMSHGLCALCCGHYYPMVRRNPVSR